MKTNKLKEAKRLRAKERGLETSVRLSVAADWCPSGMQYKGSSNKGVDLGGSDGVMDLE